MDGNALCWGYNGSGQLGDSTEADRNTPAAVSGGLSFQAIASGDHHSCGITTGGGAYCWGRGYEGELGIGFDMANREVPVPVVGGLSFSVVGLGSYNTCGLATDGHTYCWGRNDSGGVGDSSTTMRTEPMLVAGGYTLQQLTVGAGHACGLEDGGLLLCWGWNFGGQIGDGSFEDALAPREVLPGFQAAEVAAGGSHTCAITVDGPAYCWGRNFEGQLGNGIYTAPEPVPGLVIGSR